MKKTAKRAIEVGLMGLASLLLDLYVVWPFSFSRGMSAALFWTAIVIVIELALMGGVASRPMQKIR